MFGTQHINDRWRVPYWLQSQYGSPGTFISYGAPQTIISAESQSKNNHSNHVSKNGWVFGSVLGFLMTRSTGSFDMLSISMSVATRWGRNLFLGQK